MREKPGRLMLADGWLVHGYCAGDEEILVDGEVVFSTANTGLAEILSDPSYWGQIVVLAQPEVGIYGINSHDWQSSSIKVKALVVRNLSSCTSSFRAEMTLVDYLGRQQIPLLMGVDTRALIHHLRDHGSSMGVLTTSAMPAQALYDRARSLAPLEATRLSREVGVKAITKTKSTLYDLQGQAVAPQTTTSFHVVVFDFGVKNALLKYLDHYGASITLVPSDISVEELWALKPDGIFLSNGPGDPSLEHEAIATVRKILGKRPVFGVCLGHQILALALGCATYKQKFGHRGSNQSVKRQNGQIITTAQNHGFAVDDRDLSFASDTNISDHSNEGIHREDLRAFSVQFHPEGAPGPHDAFGYFEQFMHYMQAAKEEMA